MQDSIVQSVILKFAQRSALGIQKYGTTLDRTDLKTLDWINHAQEEFMDGILYLEKLKRCFQVHEIIDDAPPPSSSESESDTEEEEDLQPPPPIKKEDFIIIGGKKRPRPENYADVEPSFKKRQRPDSSISTDSIISAHEELAKHARTCGEEM